MNKDFRTNQNMTRENIPQAVAMHLVRKLASGLVSSEVLEDLLCQLYIRNSHQKNAKTRHIAKNTVAVEKNAVPTRKSCLKNQLSSISLFYSYRK